MVSYVTFALTFSNEAGLTREKHIRNTSCEQRDRGWDAVGHGSQT